MDSFSCQKSFDIQNLFLLLLLLLPVTDSISFNFSTFQTNLLPDIKFEGDAFAADNVLQLTRNLGNTNYNMSVGRVTYNQSILLWDKNTERLTDFSTHFSFIIATIKENIFGDGLTFFLAPFNSTIPQNSSGGFLGLFQSEKAINDSSGNQIVAVEFDCFLNDWDPSPDHVGINVNSIVSVENVTWESSMKDGRTANAWVSYDSSTYNLSVFLTYDDNPVFSGQPTLSHVVDLRNILPEHIRVGFSASTGDWYETHNILSWSFNSTLELETIPEGKGKNNVRVIIGSVMPIFGILTCGLGLFWFICWKKEQDRRKEDEDMNVDLENEFERGAGPKRFTYRELCRATDNFSEGGKLGEGGFGCVYEGFLTGRNAKVAVKRVSKGSKQGKKEYISEVRIISRLRHRNLVQLIGWCHEQRELLLVYEYMPNGSLDSHLFKTKATLTWTVRHKIALALASALLYLHEEWEQCVVHRDIKSSNIMLDSDFNAKLGDFGLARLVDHELGLQTTVLAGTMGYLAPEYAITGKASKESDVYSFGVVALEIACGRRPIAPMEEPNKVRLVEWVWEMYGKGRLFDAVDEGLLSTGFDERQMECLMVVGLWCCHPDHTVRPTIRQVINVLKSDEPALPSLPSKLPVPAYYVSPSDICRFTYTSSSTGLTNTGKHRTETTSSSD